MTQYDAEEQCVCFIKLTGQTHLLDASLLDLVNFLQSSHSPLAESDIKAHYQSLMPQENPQKLFSYIDNAIQSLLDIELFATNSETS